jgi:hypothetical protein
MRSKGDAMKTQRERELELKDLSSSEEGQQRIVNLWKRYNHEDPGHWQPAQGWDFPALIQGILRHEYSGSWSSVLPSPRRGEGRKTSGPLRA